MGKPLLRQRVKATDASTEVSLPIAAMRLRVSGEVARRMVLRGELEGRLEEGRWRVAVASVERALSERERAVGAA
jgi:hypothetical protein